MNNKWKSFVGLKQRHWFGVILFVGLLVMGCGIRIISPSAGGNVRNPVVAKVKFQSRPCGAPFQAVMDGSNVTGSFSGTPSSGAELQATFPGLAAGPHTFGASAGTEGLFGCGSSNPTTSFNVDVDTPYMAECRRLGVPIPPDWAETGTAWVLQGNLKTSEGGTNLLQGNQNAFVWTYSDPSVRGACIALPRGSGSAGSLAGIICQSASTGHACFWDNMLSTNQTPGGLGWSGQTLRISQLADGSNLSGATGVCPQCHRGNNVFLISPDDPTWAKVLRGPLVTSPGSTFTTRVEASSDMRDGRPRYIPVTGVGVSRPGWENAYEAGGCSSSCHEMPSTQFSHYLKMPPDCAAGGVANCYQ